MTSGQEMEQVEQGQEVWGWKSLVESMGRALVAQSVHKAPKNDGLGRSPQKLTQFLLSDKKF